MDLLEIVNNLMEFIQGNFSDVFFIVLATCALIKIASNIVKTIMSILIFILLTKMLIEMGVIYFPMPI